MKRLYIIVLILTFGATAANAQWLQNFLKATCREAIEVTVIHEQKRQHPISIKVMNDSCGQGLAGSIRQAAIHEKMITLAKTDTFGIVCAAIVNKKKVTLQLPEGIRKRYKECIMYFVKRINKFSKYQDFLKSEGISERTIGALSKIAVGVLSSDTDKES